MRTDTEKVMLCHINEEPMPLAERLPMFPHSISEFVDRMLSKIRDRPENWQEVVDFMVSAQRQAVSLQPLQIIRPKPWWKRPVFWLGILATLLVLAAVAAGILRHRFRAPDKPAPEPKQAATAAKPQPNDWESFRTRLAGLPPDSQLQELRKRLAAGTDGETAQATAKTMIQNLESELKKKQLRKTPAENFLELNKARKFEDSPTRTCREPCASCNACIPNCCFAPNRRTVNVHPGSMTRWQNFEASSGLAEATQPHENRRDDLKFITALHTSRNQTPPSPAKHQGIILAILLSIKKTCLERNNLTPSNTLSAPFPLPDSMETDANTINFIPTLLKCK